MVQHRKICILVSVSVSILLLIMGILASISDQVPETYGFVVDQTEQTIITSITKSPRRETKMPPLIVDWTTFFDTPIESMAVLPMSDCAVQCIYTSNKSQVSEAEAVIFHIRNFKPKSIPKIRHPFQRYVFFLMESPFNSGEAMKHLSNAFFNMTMTYRLDSDIVASYDWMISKQAAKSKKFSHEVYSWEQVLKIVSTKSRLVAQMVSNCNTHSAREKYAAELSRIVPVDVYGSCSGKICKNCDEMLAFDYLFYLAFENSVCLDYVTEKFWRMKRLIVPIVLRKFDYVTIVPEGSFIAADQFDSPNDLAEFLVYLSKNRTEYLKYFEWTKHYAVAQSEHFCELCKTLHEDSRPPKIYENMEEWWIDGGICENDFSERLIDSLTAKSGASKLFLLMIIILTVIQCLFLLRKRKSFLL